MAGAAATTAIVFRVTCGQVLNTVINGVAVQVECQASDVAKPPPESGGDGDSWPPKPVSGAGGVLGVTQLEPGTPLLDMDSLAAAFREGRLDDVVHPIGDEESAAFVFEHPDGTLSSLDDLLVEDDGA